MNSDELQMLKKILLDAIEKKCQKKTDCYKATEKILYSLDKLKIKVETDRQDIADMIAEKESRTAAHALRKPGGPELDDDIRHKQKVRNRERAMMRTEKLIHMVERSLDKIKDDDWYNIICYTYLVTPRMTVEEIAQKANCSVPTVFRQKKRLINEIAILLYGADALDI